MAVDVISKSVVNALGKSARQRGLTVDAYLKQLISEDGELDRVARTNTIAELATPFQKALAHLSEHDLDAIARQRPGQSAKKRSIKLRKVSRGRLNGKKPR